MKNKVFGIGWAKTGTTSLGHALKILGYEHETQRLDLVYNLMRNEHEVVYDVIEKHESFDDWPWILLYKEQKEKWPESKFILTIRDEVKWLNSYRNMLKIEGKASDELNKIRTFLYGIEFPDVSDQQLIDRYRKHNKEVRDFFSDSKDQLLELDITKGNVWSDLCMFLNIDEPSVEFPHSNHSSYKASSVHRAARKVKRFFFNS